MALAGLPPWLDVTPSQFVQAGNEGANAGLAAAHLRQSADQHAAQLAAEHAHMQQQAAMEGARLSQQQHLAEMEMQAKKEIIQQEHLRQQQQNLQLNAYRQSQLGLHQADFERKQALDEALSRQKAMTYAQESGLADFVAKGGTMAEGLVKFPMARGIVGALKAGKDASAIGEVQITPVPGGRIMSRAGTKEYKFIPDDKGRKIQNADGSIDLLMGDNTIKRVRGPQATTDSSLAPTVKPVTTLGVMERIRNVFSPPTTSAITPAAPQTGSPFQEGAIIHSKTDKSKVFVVKNGVPVPVAESTTPASEPVPEESNPDDQVE